MRAVSFVTVVMFAMLAMAHASAASSPSSMASSSTVEQGKTSKPKTATTASPLNLNTATAADLQALPGVGAATAKLIIEHRQKNGGFKKVEELMTIKGIGEKSFLKLKPMVTVGAEKPERQDAPGKGI